MMPTPASSYDEVPYESRALLASHPDRLATLATLLGMQPTPVTRCRVLELGCASGGNLLSLAESLPDSEFVGIDLSPRQIDTGRRVVEHLALGNLRLETRSILDIEPSFGTFDYIIAHGVYSWVAAPVRDHLLSVCKHNLAANGVAYVSYNTYPGWHLRAPVREMMLYHVRDLADPHQRIAQARALLDFLIHAAPEHETTWAALLRDEKELIRPGEDYYVAHEHLEEENHPVYFHQFMEHARGHGLQYLGESGGHTNLAAFPPDVQQVLRDTAGDLLGLEQYVDFVACRTFRCTLLVHDHVELNRTPGPGVIQGLLAVGQARPLSASPDIRSNAVEEFHNDKGAMVSTSAPLAKTALVTLAECWPQAVPFASLWAAAVERLGPAAPPAERGQAQLADVLLRLYLSGLVGLHTYVPPFTISPGDRPRASALARLQARTGAAVYNRRHRLLELSVLDRAVLAELDGSRARPALVEAVAQRVQRGELGLEQAGAPLADPAAVRAVLAAELDASLQRLGQLAVLLE